MSKPNKYNPLVIHHPELINVGNGMIIGKSF
jgi:hypothetical protein